MNNTYVLIMAGGEGTRFKPLSTPERPKQFLRLLGEKTFIRQTFERILPIVPTERIFVSTAGKYAGLVSEQIPELKREAVIAEPCKKNTAPALVFAARVMIEKDPDAVMICLPSDHHIADEGKFRDILSRAVALARGGFLVTLGMRPSWASPEYGYICPADSKAPWSHVARFVEKPDERTAAGYVSEGFLWNGGIFIWKAKDFLEEVEKYAPGLLPAGRSIDDYFSAAPSISVDYAIMEKSKRAAVIPCDVGWSDVGTWEGLWRMSNENGIAVSPEAKEAMFGALGLNPRAPDRKSCVRVEKPWGHEEIWAHTDKYVGKYLVIKSPHKLSYQYHRVKEETIRILEGVMDLECEGDGGRRKVRLNIGDTYHIPAGTKHRMIAVEDCKVLEVSTPHLDDVVRVEDDYGRI